VRWFGGFASALAIGGVLAVRGRLRGRFGRWRCAGDAPAMRWRCAGDALASFWFTHLGAGDFSGDSLAIFWRFTGDLLAMCWRCAGDVLAMCWRCAGCAGDGSSPLRGRIDSKSHPDPMSF